MFSVFHWEVPRSSFNEDNIIFGLSWLIKRQVELWKSWDNVKTKANQSRSQKIFELAKLSWSGWPTMSFTVLSWFEIGYKWESRRNQLHVNVHRKSSVFTVPSRMIKNSIARYRFLFGMIWTFSKGLLKKVKAYIFILKRIVKKPMDKISFSFPNLYPQGKSYAPDYCWFMHLYK